MKIEGKVHKHVKDYKEIITKEEYLELAKAGRTVRLIGAKLATNTCQVVLNEFGTLDESKWNKIKWYGATKVALYFTDYELNFWGHEVKILT